MSNDFKIIGMVVIAILFGCKKETQTEILSKECTKDFQGDTVQVGAGQIGYLWTCGTTDLIVFYDSKTIKQGDTTGFFLFSTFDSDLFCTLKYRKDTVIVAPNGLKMQVTFTDYYSDSSHEILNYIDSAWVMQPVIYDSLAKLKIVLD